LYQNAQGGAVFSTLPNPAVAVEVDNLLVQNCTFLRNKINSFSFDSFGGYGAAIYTSTQGLTVLDSNFTENQVGSTESSLNLFPQYSSAGGAIFFSTSKKSSSMNNCQFIRNSVVGGSGGAIYLLQIGFFEITHSIFVSNVVWSSYTSRAQGGALMAVKDTFVQVSASVFSRNTALPRTTSTNPLTYSGEGAAIYIQSSRVRILQMTSFAENVVSTGQFDAGAGGGAVFLEDAFDSEIDSANFTNNGALGLAEISTYAAAGIFPAKTHILLVCLFACLLVCFLPFIESKMYIRKWRCSVPQVFIYKSHQFSICFELCYCWRRAI
jgi:hypothetical protein